MSIVQISVDLILTDEQRESDYIDAVMNAIENSGIGVAGIVYAADLTDKYEENRESGNCSEHLCFPKTLNWSDHKGRMV